MLNAFIIEKEKVIKEVIEEIKGQDDQNDHFKYEQLQPTDLITIITNHQLRDLSQLLRVPAKSISQTTRYRRLKSIESILFLKNNTTSTVLKEFLGKDLYKQYLNKEIKHDQNVQIEQKREKEELVDSDFTNIEMGDKDINSVREYLIPKWNKSKDNSLESYINALKQAKKLDLFQSDEQLIYSSLIKSDQQDLVEALGEDAKTDLDKYIEYLRERFGPTSQEQRIAYDLMKQEPEESEFDWFRRCEDGYFKSRSMSIPTGNNFTDIMKQDIVYKFVSGLYNREVLRLMRLNNSAAYKEVAKIARGYATSLRDLETTHGINKVEAIDDNSRSYEDGALNELTKSVNNLVLKIEEQKNVTCYRCGYRGHMSRDCRASAKTISQYNKRKFRSRSNSRERSTSRGRHNSRSRYPSRERNTSRQRFNSNERRSSYDRSRWRNRSNSNQRSLSKSPNRFRNRSRSNDRYITDDEYYRNDRRNIRSESPWKRRDSSRRVRFSK